MIFLNIELCDYSLETVKNVYFIASKNRMINNNELIHIIFPLSKP